MKKRVLVLNCGTLVATDFNTCLRDNDEFEIWGASVYENHGVYVYKNYINDIPNIKDDDFIEILNQKISKYNFKYIVATHEDLALFLQENSEKINATIVCSCYETALLCRYKSKTYEKMKNYSFIPKTYTKEEVKKYPVFVKKDTDQGARHSYKVNSKEELDFYTKEDDMLICEYLPGEEATVDCFTNKEGKLLYCNPRMADRILAGIDVHARRIKMTKEIKYIAESLNKEIKFRGFWFFQIKKDKSDKFKLLEISTRLAGAFSLNRALDVNLPLMALKDFDGQEVEVSFNDIKVETDKQFFTKYSTNVDCNNVIIDFKSCFENQKDVNLFLIMYIYQCINQNKRLTLLVENHDDNILTYFSEKRIQVNIFNKIISKQEFIENNRKCILISNDEELKKAVRRENLYCFSTNNIEALIDWKG